MNKSEGNWQIQHVMTSIFSLHQLTSHNIHVSVSWLYDRFCFHIANSFQIQLENNSCDLHRSESAFGPKCNNSAMRQFEPAVLWAVVPVKLVE